MKELSSQIKLYKEELQDGDQIANALHHRIELLEQQLSAHGIGSLFFYALTCSGFSNSARRRL